MAAANDKRYRVLRLTDGHSTHSLVGDFPTSAAAKRAAKEVKETSDRPCTVIIVAGVASDDGFAPTGAPEEV